MQNFQNSPKTFTPEVQTKQYSGLAIGVYRSKRHDHGTTLLAEIIQNLEIVWGSH